MARCTRRRPRGTEVDVAIRSREFENDPAITVRRLAETKRLLETNDSYGVRAAAPEHLGILMQPMTIIHEDVVAGRRVPVLTEWGLQRVTINTAYPTRRHLPAKLRCFVDFLIEQFALNDIERRRTAQGRSRPQGNGQCSLAQRLTYRNADTPVSTT